MAVREIIYKNETIARYIPDDSWAESLGFYSEDSEYLQVGTWKYDKGKELLRHYHNVFERSISRTNEVLFVKKGSVKAKIYSLDEKFVEEITLNSGDTMILLNCGHGYKILEDDTQVLEIKNGPYPGADVDRRRF